MPGACVGPAIGEPSPLRLTRLVSPRTMRLDLDGRTAMAQSDIEWTEQTWNPTTGCTKISSGCKHCYAERLSERLQAMGAPGYDKGFALALHPERIEYPMTVRRPTVFFVNSMSDLFHQAVPDAFIERVFKTIAATPRHTYQVLTKRAARMRRFFGSRSVPTNAWLGVSVENRRHGVPRIAELRAIEAGVKFLSVEPLLEDLGPLDLTGLQWVIVGGESGPGARPMAPAWARRVRDQARRDGCAFFFKQWGAWGADGVRRTKKANGRQLDGRTWDAMPTREVRQSEEVARRGVPEAVPELARERVSIQKKEPVQQPIT